MDSLELFFFSLVMLKFSKSLQTYPQRIDGIVDDIEGYIYLH